MSTMARMLGSLVAVLFVGLCAGATAQEQLMEITGRVHGHSVNSVAPVGDLTGDGTLDFVVGADSIFTHGGFVMVVDGASGEFIREHSGPVYHQIGWWIVKGIGDFDGDGVPDYCSGSQNSGYLSSDGEVWVWSGATGDLITYISGSKYSDKYFGDYIAPLGDVDGDGYSDFATGWEYAGELWILGGPDGHLIRNHFVQSYNFHMSVAGIGDVDGDGRSDYVVGTPVNYPYSASVFSGKTGSLLYAIEPPDQGLWAYMGRGVAGMGDLDGDGIGDFAASAVFNFDCDASNQERSGWIRFFSGKDGHFLKQLVLGPVSQAESPGGCPFWWLDGGQDVNGDGVGDLLTRGWRTFDTYYPEINLTANGNTAVFSGRTGTMLWREYPGWQGALMGDMDGDGISEWAHGNEQYFRPAILAGRVRIFKGFAGDGERICWSAPNSTGKAASLELDGPISIGNNDLSISIEDGVPGEPAFFFYGTSEVQRPMGSGVLCVSGGIHGLITIGDPVQLDENGYGTVKVDMTQGQLAHGPAPWKPGLTRIVQAWYSDPASPAGFGLTDAYRITFVP